MLGLQACTTTNSLCDIGDDGVRNSRSGSLEAGSARSASTKDRWEPDESGLVARHPEKGTLHSARLLPPDPGPEGARRAEDFRQPMARPGNWLQPAQAPPRVFAGVGWLLAALYFGLAVCLRPRPATGCQVSGHSWLPSLALGCWALSVPQVRHPGVSPCPLELCTP